MLVKFDNGESMNTEKVVWLKSDKTNSDSAHKDNVWAAITARG